MLEIYEIIQPYLIPAINLLGKGLDFLAKAAKWVADNFSTILGVVGPLVAGIVAYNVVTGAASMLTKGLAAAFKILNIVMSLNPVGLIVAGIVALTVAVVACWQKFAGFRAAILTVWDTIKGFGSILKEYVIDRIQSLLAGIGKVGEALGKLFKGDFSGAWNAAKGAYSLMVGAEAMQNAVAASKDLVKGFSGTYQMRLADEKARQSARDSIGSPKAAGGAAQIPGGLGAGAGAAGSGTSGSAVAKDIATGGTRNTSIVLNIGKFFEDVNITTTNGRDLQQIQDAVLESINRSLEIATSAAR